MTSDELPHPSFGTRRVEQFRGAQPRPPLHPAERRLLTVLGVHLCFLPWALGTMQPWGQWISLGLALIGFGLAIKSRAHVPDSGWSAGPFRLPMWPRLVRFPLFWIGLSLLLYVLVQALNPSWRFTRNETVWWLESVPNVAWLPTSVDAPFIRSNPWRQLVIYGAAWLVVCSAWTGLTRRRSSRILLGVLMANAIALGALLVYQRVTDDLRVPWPLTALTKEGITAGFIYRNHAGGYLTLVTFCAIALATWGYDQGSRALKKSTPAAVLILVTFFLVGAVLFTFSRGAPLTLGGALAAFALWFFLRRWRLPSVAGTDYRVTAALVLIFGAFVFYVGRNLDFSEIERRFDSLVDGQSRDQSVSSRMQARAAGKEMLDEHGWRGVGAGGFRHRFPEYVQYYPEIYEDGKMFWEHTHNDWLEIPIELGAGGVAILLAGAGWGVSVLIRRRALWHSTMIPVLFGCGATLAHAWIDFPFQCPAILVTWCLLVTLVLRSLQLEAKMTSGETLRS